MIFAYGTQGTDAENEWAFAKARYDAEQFYYRGNGSIDVVADTAFDSNSSPDRNIILYGNSSTNSLWDSLLGNSPVNVGNGFVKIGCKHPFTHQIFDSAQKLHTLLTMLLTTQIFSLPSHEIRRVVI